MDRATRSYADIVEEAPNDAAYYIRRNKAWESVSLGASVAVNFEVGANGVTAGNVVELVSDGVQDLQNIYHCEAPSIGSLVTLDGTNNCVGISTVTKDASSCFVGYGTGTNVYCGVLNAGSPPTLTYKSAALGSDSTNCLFSMCSLSSNTGAITHVTTTGSLLVRSFEVSGTNPIAFGAFAALGGQAAINSSTCALTSSNWFVAYADTNSDCQIRTAVSNGTNAPTLGSTLNVNGTNNADYLSLARTSDTTAMLVLRDSSSSNGEIAHITGGDTNAPAVSTLAHLDGTNNCTHITQAPIDSTHTLCAYNNATTSNGKLAVIQANGTNAPTVISRAVFETNGGAAYNSLTAHSANLHTLLWDDGTSNYGHALTIGVDSNYNLTLTPQISGNIQGTNSTAYQAVTALTPTTAIAAFQGLGSDGFAGTLTLTPTPTISGQLLGISQDTATNGTATVDLGPVWNTTNTLTLGEEYFANPAGGLTTNATPVFVGTADTTGSLVLDLSGNPAVGLKQVWEITTPGAFTFTAPEDGEYEIVFCGGGGGGMGNTTIANATGGNSGNVVILNKALAVSASISGTIGAGGAGASGAGTNGSDSTVIVLGSTYTAKGGRASTVAAAGDGSRNRENDSYANNILGGCGGTYNNESFGGVTPILGSSSQTTGSAGKAGTRGGGGTGAAGGQTSGAGGSGVCRITLKRGT
jgi:hypothetical protein